MTSVKPSVQRKELYNASMHRRHKLASAHLSKELRDKLGARSLPVRVGDTVVVMKGDYKGKRGKVTEVDLKGLWVKIEGLTKKKADGTEVLVKFRPWNLLIVDLNTKDPWRRKILERRGAQAPQSATAGQGEVTSAQAQAQQEVKQSGGGS